MAGRGPCERIRQIIASGKTEIPRYALAFGPRWIEDERDGSFYRVYPNSDPAYSDHYPAFYFDEAGDAVLLERAPGEPRRARAEAGRASGPPCRARRGGEAAPRRGQAIGGDVTRVLVRIAKIIDDAVWENPEAIGPDRELFWPRALKLRSERIQDGKPVPIRVDHIKRRQRACGPGCTLLSVVQCANQSALPPAS